MRAVRTGVIGWRRDRSQFQSQNHWDLDGLDGEHEQAGGPRFQAWLVPSLFTKLANARGRGGLGRKHGFTFGQVHYFLTWLIGHLCGEYQQIWNRSCWREVATWCLLSPDCRAFGSMSEEFIAQVGWFLGACRTQVSPISFNSLDLGFFGHSASFPLRA